MGRAGASSCCLGASHGRGCLHAWGTHPVLHQRAGHVPFCSSFTWPCASRNPAPQPSPTAGYCIIAVVLAAMHCPAPGIDYTPLVDQTAYERVFSVFNALTTIMFAVRRPAHLTRRRSIWPANQGGM